MTSIFFFSIPFLTYAEENYLKISDIKLLNQEYLDKNSVFFEFEITVDKNDAGNRFSFEMYNGWSESENILSVSNYEAKCVKSSDTGEGIPMQSTIIMKCSAYAKIKKYDSYNPDPDFERNGELKILFKAITGSTNTDQGYEIINTTQKLFSFVLPSVSTNNESSQQTDYDLSFSEIKKISIDDNKNQQGAFDVSIYATIKNNGNKDFTISYENLQEWSFGEILVELTSSKLVSCRVRDNEKIIPKGGSLEVLCKNSPSYFSEKDIEIIKRMTNFNTKIRTMKKMSNTTSDDIKLQTIYYTQVSTEKISNIKKSIYCSFNPSSENNPNIGDNFCFAIVNGKKYQCEKSGSNCVLNLSVPNESSILLESTCGQSRAIKFSDTTEEKVSFSCEYPFLSITKVNFMRSEKISKKFFFDVTIKNIGKGMSKNQSPIAHIEIIENTGKQIWSSCMVRKSDSMGNLLPNEEVTSSDCWIEYLDGETHDTMDLSFGIKYADLNEIYDKSYIKFVSTKDSHNATPYLSLQNISLKKGEEIKGYPQLYLTAFIKNIGGVAVDNQFNAIFVTVNGINYLLSPNNVKNSFQINPGETISIDFFDILNSNKFGEDIGLSNMKVFEAKVLFPTKKDINSPDNDKKEYSFNITNPYNTLSGTHLFSDISSSSDFYDAIKFVKEKTIVKGYDDGEYKPYKNINRAEFIKILIESKFSKDEIFGSNCFEDVKNDWFAPYVCTAKQKGIISGYADNTFKPDQIVNFAEASKILVNTLIEKTNSEEGQDWWLPYSDKLFLKTGIKKNGDQKLNRGEMAEFIYKIFQ